MNLLRRELAPIVPEAWEEIEEQVRRVLVLNLAGRKLVDFEGPHGWDYAAVNLGRMHMLEESLVEGVGTGVRRVQPLLELRVPARLKQMELDSIGRGAKDADLDPLVKAAEKLALAEDTAIFHGFEQVGIRGLLHTSTHSPMSMPSQGVQFLELAVDATETLRRAEVGGPYALALGPRPYDMFMETMLDGYPLRNRIEKIIEGPIVRAPALENGVLLSIRGGDFSLSVGQDISIGYAHYDKEEVELYLTETFTFRVIEPDAAVVIR